MHGRPSRSGRHFGTVGGIVLHATGQGSDSSREDALVQPPSANIGKYIVPIYQGVKVHDRAIARRPAGTGFILGDGVLVTCWHCVSQPCSTDEVYLAYLVDDDGKTYLTWYQITDVAQDENGSDLALGRVAYRPPAAPALTLAPTADVAWGAEVRSFGYPFTAPLPTGPQAGFVMEPRLFRGYVTAVMNEDVPGWGTVPTIECDMPAPAGMSGAPLFDVATPTVIGVIYGDWSTQTEGRAPVTFARAHYSSTLLSARGPATRGLTLAEYVAAPAGD
jgi:S1-C subfamily serine protease